MLHSTRNQKNTMNDKYISKVGEFVCQVDNPGEAGWFGESKEKGTPFIRLPLTVLDEGDQKGKIITWQGWLSDAAFDNTVMALAKAFPEWDGSLEALLPEGSFSFQGLQCSIVVESEEYEGKTYFKVKWLNSINGGGSARPLAAEKLKSLISKNGRKSQALVNAARSQAGVASTPRASGVPAGSGAVEDQLPV